MEDILDELNRTELLAIARHNEIPGAGPSVPRSVLMEALRCMKRIPSEPEVDSVRRRYSKWLTANWNIVRSQLPKDVCPDCFQCCDLQVMACFLRDQHQLM